MKHKTHVVTGGAGFIGSHVVNLLIEKGDKVIVVDDLSNGKKENVHKDAQLVILDISKDLNKPNLQELMSGVDTVFHLAGFFHPDMKAVYFFITLSLFFFLVRISLLIFMSSATQFIAFAKNFV